MILGNAAKKRATNIPVVPKAAPIPARVPKVQNGTSTVPTQPTPELPQSASVIALIQSTSKTVSANNELSTVQTSLSPDNTENKKPDTSGTVSRPVSQNPLTAIANDKTMILTRQYRQRIRIKYSGERAVRLATLNERNTTKENIPKMSIATTASSGASVDKGFVKDPNKDDKTMVNSSGLKPEPNTSSATNESVEAANRLSAAHASAAVAAAVRKVKKKVRKIASSANGKINRGYKVETKCGEKLYPCRHCGRKYRWKSTLRRHENDECGGKEPAYQCPYCSYKAKQRGNLGVHVRKHHSDKPKLESCRKRKTI